jgi:two-component system sensor histidine kinase BaeS
VKTILIVDDKLNALRLVEDLRTLSPADAGELKLICASVAPEELLKRVAESFGTVAADADVRLNVSVEAGVPDVWVDAERMTQVLGNLVMNALRHTPAGGSVTVAASRDADHVLLTITDTGSGIAPDDLPKVFDRFYRAAPARTVDGNESGLGMAIAKSSLEAHKGTISAKCAARPAKRRTYSAT